MKTPGFVFIDDGGDVWLGFFLSVFFSIFLPLFYSCFKFVVKL